MNDPAGTGEGAPKGGMHAAIVEALGDATATAACDPSGFLPADAWGAAVERTRQARYPAMTAAEGHRRLGQDVANAFLAGPAGKLVAATLPELELDRAFASVLLPFAERMRRAFEWDFTPHPEGGLVRLRGRRVVPVEHIEGFFSALVARVRGHYRVTRGTVSDAELELRISKAP